MAELIINGKDAQATWGVKMGEGFISTLRQPVPLKPFIESKSRLEDGKRVVVANPKKDEREISLTFTIIGNTPADFQRKRDLFFEELYKGGVTIHVPSDGKDVYHLIYLGRSVSLAQGKTGRACRITSRFSEPNPANRV